MLKINFWDHQSSKHPQEWTKSGLRSKNWFLEKLVIFRWGASKLRFHPGALICTRSLVHVHFAWIHACVLDICYRLCVCVLIAWLGVEAPCETSHRDVSPSAPGPAYRPNHSRPQGLISHIWFAFDLDLIRIWRAFAVRRAYRRGQIKCPSNARQMQIKLAVKYQSNAHQMRIKFACDLPSLMWFM